MKYMTDGERFRRDSFICNVVTGIIVALFIILVCYTLISSSTNCDKAEASANTISEHVEEPSISPYIHLVYLEEVETEGFGTGKTTMAVVYDSNTMVMYVLYGGSMNPIYNADGTLKLYQPTK